MWLYICPTPGSRGFELSPYRTFMTYSLRKCSRHTAHMRAWYGLPLVHDLPKTYYAQARFWRFGSEHRQSLCFWACITSICICLCASPTGHPTDGRRFCCSLGTTGKKAWRSPHLLNELESYGVHLWEAWNWSYGFPK